MLLGVPTTTPSTPPSPHVRGASTPESINLFATPTETANWKWGSRTWSSLTRGCGGRGAGLHLFLLKKCHFTSAGQLFSSARHVYGCDAPTTEAVFHQTGSKFSDESSSRLTGDRLMASCSRRGVFRSCLCQSDRQDGSSDRKEGGWARLQK